MDRMRPHQDPLPPRRHHRAPAVRTVPVDDVVEKKVKKKTDAYVGTGMIKADEFRVGVMYSTGGCDKGMLDFLSLLARATHLPFEDLLADVTNTVMWAQGAAIEAAFKMAARARAIEV